MARWRVWLDCLGEAVCARGLRALLGAIPFVDAIMDVAGDALERARSREREEDLRDSLQALAQAPPAEVKSEAEAVAEHVAAHQPPEVRQKVAAWLSQVPAATRHSLRRPEDPTGRTIPPGMSLANGLDLVPLLPQRPPRFKPGDRPESIGDWELVELLGAGGFGEVWKARHIDFDGTWAAIKFCLDPSAQQRLLQHEGKVVSQVLKHGRHPGIVTLLDARLRSDPPWLRYEYIDGGDLSTVLPEVRGPKATGVIRDIAAIVGHFHRLSPPVIHRDLKPSNILVQRRHDGSLGWHVADFGIGAVAAQQALSEANRPTIAGSMMGTMLHGAYTPLYASPEQKRNNPPDPRDDVHALGVIWYQLLVGDLTRERPGGRGWRKALAAQGIPEPTLDLVERCFDDEVSVRPKDGAEMVQELDKLAGQPRPRPAPGPRTAPPAAPPADQRPVKKPETPKTGATKEGTNSIGMRLRLIPAGKFMMGSPSSEQGHCSDEGPQHEVEITRPFYLGVFAVTQAEYEAVVGRNPALFSKTYHGGPDHPVEGVSWEDAVDFCRRLSELPAEKAAGRAYRLPTEAEWEYACRAGTTTAFWWGGSATSTHANFNGNDPYGGAPKGPYLQRTTKVGSYQPNPWGLFDTLGNVREWCADWYDEGYYRISPRQDPRGPDTGKKKCQRGGGWADVGNLCRIAIRLANPPTERNALVGFRVVCTVQGTRKEGR